MIGLEGLFVGDGRFDKIVHKKDVLMSHTESSHYMGMDSAVMECILNWQWCSFGVVQLIPTSHLL